MYKPGYSSLYITITCIRDRPINFLWVEAVFFAHQARNVFSRETNARLLFFRHTKSVFFSSSNYTKPFRWKLLGPIIYFLYARLETGGIMWLGMAGERASTQVSAQ